jgi:hypothetical protein
MVVRKEILRMAIRLRRGRALTDRVQGLWRENVDDVFAKTRMAPPRPTTRTLGTLRLPTAAKLHAGAMNLPDVALHPSLAAHAQGGLAGLTKNRNGEGTGQTARVAAWEDEGGATACLK